MILKVEHDLELIYSNFDPMNIHIQAPGQKKMKIKQKEICRSNRKMIDITKTSGGQRAKI